MPQVASPLPRSGFRSTGQTPVLLKLLFAVLGSLLLGSCAPQDGPGPFELTEDRVWRLVNRSHTGADGIFVQATFRTFAYEVARIYAEAEIAGLGQEQVTSRLREFIYDYIDAPYPMADGTDVNSLYLQYLVFVNPDFDVTNPLQKAQFDTWRGQYVRRLLGILYDGKYPLLRPVYDERWGYGLYSRLVFTIYIDGEESGAHPYIADIGERTFLIDERGVRHRPSGTDGAYPYKFDRPEQDYLKRKAVYRLYFPNRRADRRTPILTSDSRRVSLVIEGLGSEPERRLDWDLPVLYPTSSRRLVPPAEVDSVQSRRESKRAPPRP